MKKIEENPVLIHINPTTQDPVLSFWDLINNQNISIEDFDSSITLMKEHGLEIDQTRSGSYLDPSTNTWIPRQESFLNSLFSMGYLEKAKVLIKHGMDVNFVDPTVQYAKSPLLALIDNRNISIEDFDSLITLMKEHGLRMDQIQSMPYFDSSTNTWLPRQELPLISLLNSGYTEKAKVLIKQGMDVNFVDPTAPLYAKSPLLALINYSPIGVEDFNSLITLMKEHGLEMDQTQSGSYFDSSTNTWLPHQESPLISLLNSGYTEKVKVLIKHGVDVNFVDPTVQYAKPPLLALINNPSIGAEDFNNLITLMKEHGLRMDQTQSMPYFNSSTNTWLPYQESPLISLFSPDSAEKAKVLIKHGMDVNFVDPTAQHAASPLLALINKLSIGAEDFNSLITLMKEHGLRMDQTQSSSYFDPSTNSQIPYQESPLICLFNMGCAEKAKILIKHGMDVNFVDPTTQHATSPLWNLINSNISIEDFDSLITLMKEHGLKMDQTKSVSYFNPSTNTQVSYQESPFIFLFDAGYAEKAKILIEHGMDVNFVDPIRHSSPYQSIFFNHTTLMGFLHEAIIFGHNMVTAPINNDHKTNAAIAIFKYKLGDKEALNKSIIEGEGVLDLCQDYLSPIEYWRGMIKGVNLGDGIHHLSSDAVSLIFAYSTLRDLASWVQKGLALPALTPEQDILGLLTYEQEPQTPTLEQHESNILGDEIVQIHYS